MNFDKAIEFAKSVNAKVTIPLDPLRKRDMHAKTDVQRTWDLYYPKDFDDVPSERRKQA